MCGVRIFLFVLLGVVCCSHDWISGPVSEVTVRPGDNITLYCDCKIATGVYIVWYRNCSHVNQPSLELKPKIKQDSWKRISDAADVLNPIPRFHFVKNQSSDSYDLLIMNISDSDEGLYYCGTEQFKTEHKDKIIPQFIYQYGNTTRILINSSVPLHHETLQHCAVCWTLLFALCPASAVLSSLLSSLLVYRICQKTAQEAKANKGRLDTRGRARGNMDEDVCYAALEIHQTLQRPRKKKTQSSATYSAIGI